MGVLAEHRCASCFGVFLPGAVRYVVRVSLVRDEFGFDGPGDPALFLDADGWTPPDHAYVCAGCVGGYLEAAVLEADA